MEVDEIHRQVSKFQKISCNGSSVGDNSSNPNKIAIQNRLFPVGDGGGGGGGDGGGVGRFSVWPASRIVRVSRASGGKDRHSKVLTSKGLRDRRIRLSVSTAIEFYDLQDRLGYDQPSKAVEWLIKAASSSISELPSLDPSFSGADGQNDHHIHQMKKLVDDKKPTGNAMDFEDPNHQQNNNSCNNNVSLSKSSACSSTSETSKGSGLSLSRSENRIRARERARDMAAKKEKEKESTVGMNTVNGTSQNSSFTDLLTGGINSTTVSPNNNSDPTASTESRIHWTTPMDYFQMPQFNIPSGDNQPHHPNHFSFLQQNFAPVVTAGGGGGPSYNLNFSIASSSSRGGFASGLNRVTLQSNLLSTSPHHHHQLQRFHPSSMVDGSTSTNFPFFTAPTPDNFPATGYDAQRLQLYGGGDGGGRHSDHYKENQSTKDLRLLR